MKSISSIFNRRSTVAMKPYAAELRRRTRRSAAVTEVLESRVLLTAVPQQTITTAVTWTAANSPYVIGGFGVTVGAGGSLTIDSGVTVSGAPLGIALGGSVSANGVDFVSSFTAKQGASGSVTNSSFNGSAEFDNTGVTLSNDAFTTNPLVYPTYIPMLIGGGNTFASGTIIDIESTTLNSALMLPTVANVSAYDIQNYGMPVASGGALTIASGVTLNGSVLTIGSGGSIAATDVHFNGAFTAQLGATGSVSGSFFNSSTEFDNTEVTLSNDAFTTNPLVYPTYVPNLVGNGDTFATATIVDIESTTLSSPLTLPVVTNVSDYNLQPYGMPVASGGALTIDSGVTLTGSALSVNSGGEISADGATLDVNLTLNGASTVWISNCNVSAASITSAGNGGPIAMINNWWGTTVLSTIQAKIDDQTNNSALPAVTFQPFLDTAPVLQSVASTISLGTSVTSANAGDAVILTATLGGTAGSAPSGTVNFVADGVYLGTGVIVNGSAALSTMALPTGSDEVAAGYGGDTNYSGNTSAPVAVDVTAVAGTTASTTTLATSTNQVTPGSQVTLTATVTGSGQTPTGMVTFTENGTTIGTAQVQSDGTAQTSTSSLPLGNDSIVAIYSGDTNYAASTSSSMSVDVSSTILNASAITLASSSNPAAAGTTVTFTATVTSASGSGPTPTGTVNYFLNSTLLGSADVGSDGTAAFSTASLPVGTDPISATYSGDSNYSASSQAAENQTITRPAVAVNLGGVQLPAQVVGSTPFKPKVPIVVTNDTTKMNGLFTVVLYVNSSPSFDGNQTLLTSKAEHFSLGEGKSKVVPFTFKALSLTEAPGTYYILAQVTDPNNDIAQGASTATIQIETPDLALQVTPQFVTPNVSLNKSGTATVTVSNAGNEPLTGTLQISLGLSSDGTNAVPNVTIATLAKHVTMKIGKGGTYKLHFKATAGLTLGAYYPVFSVSLDGAVQTVVGTTQFTIG